MKTGIYRINTLHSITSLAGVKENYYIVPLTKEQSDTIAQVISLKQKAVREKTAKTVKKKTDQKAYKTFVKNNSKLLNSLGFVISDVYLLGTTNKVSSRELNKIFGHKTDSFGRNHYPCFAYPNRVPNPLVAYHEDGRSSFNCLLNKIGNPTHCAILKVNADTDSYKELSKNRSTIQKTKAQVF